jgi:long-chain acyl-CoA synthetase
MSEAALPPGWPAMSVAQAHQILTGPGTLTEMEEKVIRGVSVRTFKNLPPTFGAMLEHARRFGPRTFLVYEDERASYEAFYRAAAAIARDLQAQGVAKGDRVAIIMRNVPEWVAVFYGVLSIGAIATPLNAWWTGPELEYGLRDSGAKVVLADFDRYERIAEHLPNLPELKRLYVSRADAEIAHPRVVSLESVIGRTEDWASLPDQGPPGADVEPDDLATLLYTSGTTGAPKGALGTHRGAMTNVFTAAVAGARNFLRRGEAPPAPDPNLQRATLISVPLFHVTGSIAVLNPHVYTGAKIVMMHRWDPVRAFQIIERERINAAGGVPTIAWQLIEHPERSKYDLSSLETVSYGGAPSAPELVRKIREMFPNAQPGNGWGMTETTGTVTVHSGEDYLNRPESCGPPTPVADLKVVDPIDGVTVLPPGQVGEIWAKGPHIAAGYWNKPEATAKTFVDGWIRTGDLGRLDEEGFCYVVDRAKDMLIRGGENIYCIEVENALYDHPSVMDAALVGVPHRTLGEEPAAVVSLKPGAQATEEELRAHVAVRLAAFKVPVAIRFWPETLPRNANGKILKSELKKLFAG